MDFETYQALPGVNWSSLKWLRKSPLKYRYMLEHERADTGASRKGRALHVLLFEPDKFDDLFAVFNMYGDKRKNPVKKHWDAFKKAHAESDKTILDAKEHDLVQDMASAVMESELAAPWLENITETEKTIQWEDEETGRLMKGRLDAYGVPCVRDLKTAEDIDPKRLQANAWRFGYDCQMTMYHDGAKANGLDVSESPRIIVVESVKPHDVHVYRVDHDIRATARQKYRGLLRLLETCEQSNYWPGQQTTEWSLEYPAFADQADAELMSLGASLGF